MLRLTGSDHVGLKVTDMDKTLDFYQRLGLTLLRTSGPNVDGDRSAVMQVGGQELNIFSHRRFVSGTINATSGHLLLASGRIGTIAALASMIATMKSRVCRRR